MTQNIQKAYLLLEDGTVFSGYAMGKSGTAIGEVVFNTCTASYEELLSDPTYYGQIVAQTYPLVGNRGVSHARKDSEIMSNGYIVREWCDVSGEGALSLDDYLREQGIVGIYGIDTRRLTRALRDKGYMKGAITDSLADQDTLLEQIKQYTISGAVEAITVKAPERLETENAAFRVAVLDYGFPRKTLEAFTARGCSMDILPANYTAEQVAALAPDGILLSDGPADPDDNPELIDHIRDIVKLGVPVFAIGLGYQMLSLAVGAKIVKMPQGHRGSNQPVRIENTDRLMVTDQNHGYCVARDSVLPETADILFTNINDHSVEGLQYKAFAGIGVQFTPSGDRDSSTAWIFDRFLEMMQEVRA